MSHVMSHDDNVAPLQHLRFESSVYNTNITELTYEL